MSPVPHGPTRESIPIPLCELRLLPPLYSSLNILANFSRVLWNTPCSHLGMRAESDPITQQERHYDQCQESCAFGRPAMRNAGLRTERDGELADGFFQDPSPTYTER